MKSIALAERIGATCEGPDVELAGIASFSAATSQDLVFVEHPRYLAEALVSAAGAVILPRNMQLPEGTSSLASQNHTTAVPPSEHGKALLHTENPRLAFALAAAELRRTEPHVSGVDATAMVHPSAQVHSSAFVGQFAVIEAGARIGPRTRIAAGCVIEAGVVIGADCQLGARVVVYSGATLGDRVTVKAGAVLGSDGFGFVPDPATGHYHKFPQVGRLEIGNDVEIGANTTIDRGALDATVIGDGVKLDNLVQIAHNVRLGRNVVVASQTGISGSSVLEDNVLVGGQVGIADHVHIGQGVVLGAQCGIPSKKILRGKGILFWGTPARPITEYLRELATLARLTKKKL